MKSCIAVFSWRWSISRILTGCVLIVAGLGAGGLIQSQDLILTEFVADGDFGLADEDGELQDWIELYNPQSVEVSLEGWYLTDDKSDLRRWRFPGGSIGPQGFLVVFASGKDRRDPAGFWHTNFKLEREGEYLALVRPDGMTRSTEFDPQYPAQLPGTSYGIGMTEERSVLVGQAAPGRAKVPVDGEGGGAWMLAGYPDGGWTPVELGIGYERPGAGVGDPPTPVEDVTRPGDVIQPTSFNSPGNEGVALAIDNSTATKYLNFDKLNAGFTVTPALGATVVVGLRVSSANDAPERDPVSFTLAGSNDGVQFTEIARGGLPDFPARFFTVEVRFENSVAFRHYRLLFPEVRNAAGAVAMQVSEVELLGSVEAGAPTFGELIRSNVEGLMFGRNASIQVRLPFVLSESMAVDDLLLRVRYDDGFVAYLNGSPIAEANAPASLAFDSAALADRSRTEAVQEEVFGLAGRGELLSPGGNVLAIQGLNDRRDSLDFLLSAELVNQRVLMGGAGYFASPTPGGVNAASSQGRVAEPIPSVGRGFYESPVEVVLQSATEGATIRYTTDGSVPSVTAGNVYEGPIGISGTRPLRAIAYKEGWLTSTLMTHTYLLVPEVVGQSEASAAARGFPSQWGSTAADYGMDQRIIGPRGQEQYGGVYSRTIRSDLLALPSLSLVMPVEDWFGPQGIYSNPENRGDAWERAASVEMIDPGDPQGGWQATAGLRIQGGAFRRFDLTKKKSFRVIFRRAYGPGMLEYPLFGPAAVGELNNFILRANSNDAWPYGGGSALYVRDAFAMETARAMGMVSSHTRFMHLYINGLYWGLYNPVERPDAAFSSAYHGGERETWDALNQDGLVDGTADAWNRMLGILAGDMTDPAIYQQVQGRNPDGTINPTYENLLDVDNMIDYMILNFYIGNGDWPGRNYWVGRNREGPEGFQFYPWDSETALGMTGLTADRTGVDGAVARPYAATRLNADFRMRFADRAHRHFSEGGVFYVNPAAPAWDPEAPDNNPLAARFAALASVIESPMVAESARWGDQMGAGPYTRNDHWARARDSLLADYFPRRSAIVLEQFRAAGLYPRTEAPRIEPRGGVVEQGQEVTLDAPEGIIYYSTDGSDPRQPVEIQVVSRRALVESSTPRRVLVPTVANGGSGLGEAWRAGQPGFDDSGWIAGVGGVGYDTGLDYTGVIGIDVRGELYNQNGSIFLRIPFEFDGQGGDRINTMTLRVRVDDGFAAYLNGVLVASLNAPAVPDWDSLATGLNPDEAAVQFRPFDITANLGALRTGLNLLAIQGFNVTLSSSDFLLDAELEVGEQQQIGGGITAERYSGPIVVTDLTTIKARVLQGGEWSALTEATFVVGQPRLVITELHYHPTDPTAAELAAGFSNDDDFEFIEFYNAGNASLDLRGVRVVDGVEFSFNDVGVTRLAPGEFLLLVQNRAAFEFRYGTGLPVAGEYQGRFSNSGERVEVLDAAGRSLVVLNYGTVAPWPATADGSGPSLTLTDLNGDANWVGSWQASSIGGGTPGWGEVAGELRIEYMRWDGEGLRLGFNGRAGKTYGIRARRDWTDAWGALQSLPSQGDGMREVEIEPWESRAFFQLIELP